MYAYGQPRQPATLQGWPLWAQFALSVSLVVTALGLRWFLGPVLGEQLPFITISIVLLPLVVLVRPWPFLAGAMLALLGVLYLFAPPPFSFKGNWSQGSLFVVAIAAATLTAWLAQRAEDRSRSADAMLRSFVDESPTCKWITGADGRIAYANKALASALGRTPQEIVGHTHEEILPPALAKLAVQHIESVRKSGQTCTSFEELEPLDAKGSRRVLEWRRFALKVDGQDRVLVAGMANDITEKARMEKALRENEARLASALEERTREVKSAVEHAMIAQRMAAVGTMAAGLAHDMNNLLLPLESRTDVLLAIQNLPPRVRDELAVIAALCDHLRSLSKNLSLFARDPRRDGVAGPTNLPRWCRQVARLLEASLGVGPGRVTLRWDCPEQLPDVEIAPHRLTQAVQNLVHNARDAVVATEAADGQRGDGVAGRIVVEARALPSGAAVLLSVSDNGAGMSDEVRRRCIEPFFTTKDGAARVPGANPHLNGWGGGTGLGLSLAYQVVEQAGGTMDIKSQPGEGTTITLALPTARTAQVGAAVESRA